MVVQLAGSKGHDFSLLAECLKQFEDEELVFIPNPGNAGDMLINLGMYHLFEQLGVRYVTGSPDQTYPDRVLVYSGGGALIDAYPTAARFFKANHALCKNLILLPHTVRAQPELIAAMDDRCFLFAREANSETYLNAHRTQAHVLRTHDLAFFLDEAAITAAPWSRAVLLDKWRRKAWPRFVLKLMRDAMLTDPVLHCLRADAEATGVDIPAHNHDLSKLFAHGDLSRDSCATTIKTLRFVMKRFSAIRTNRLHITVLGALLDMPVTMLDNSYGKNRDIYDASIDGYFSNVTFEGAKD